MVRTGDMVYVLYRHSSNDLLALQNFSNQGTGLHIKEFTHRWCENDGNEDPGQIVPVDSEVEHKAFRHVGADTQEQHQEDEHRGSVYQHSGEDHRD
jgi:hypothetical protein